MSYRVLEARRWRHVNTGATASIYGAVPYTSEAERGEWRIESCGWTVINERTGAVGVGREPWESHAEAAAWAESHTKRPDTRTVIPNEQWKEGARLAVLAALDEYVRGELGHVGACGATDAELPSLFRALDAHMDKVAERVNGGTEPGSAFFRIEQAAP